MHVERLSCTICIPSSVLRTQVVFLSERGHTRAQTNITVTNVTDHLTPRITFSQQEAFEKCWAHSRLRAASSPLTRCRYRYCRAPPAHRCPRRQRQRVTEGTAMAPWNGPNNMRAYLRWWKFPVSNTCSHCDSLGLWPRAEHTAMPTLSQPFYSPRNRKIKYQLSSWVMMIDGDDGCGR